MYRALYLGLAAALAAATPAAAQTVPGSFGVGITAGTLGIGPEASYRMSDHVALRANGTFFGFSHDVDSSDVTYNGKLKLRSFGAMIDVHPFGGSFRISGGARIGNNKVRLKATPTEEVEIGDNSYTADQVGTLSGEVKAKDFAPTLTLGWGGSLSPGLKFGFEAGAMFQGKPRVENLRATGSAASTTAFQNSLREEEQEIEEDIDQYKVYPILQIGLSYRF